MGATGEKDRGAASEFALALPPEAEHVRTARLFAAALARHYGCDEERIDDLKIAISEATTNSIKAHRVLDEAEPVRIEATRAKAELLFRVIDLGEGFEAGGPTEDPTFTPAEGLWGGSLGLALIRALFPEVEIVRNPERGMTVTFRMDLASPRSAS